MTTIRRTDTMCAGTLSGTDVKVTTVSATTVTATSVCGTTLSGTNVYGAVTAVPGHKRYTWDTGPLTAATIMTATHGLGARPTYCQVSLVCMTANCSYAVDDEIFAFPNYYDATYSRLYAVYADATHVGLATDDHAFLIYNKGTATASAMTLNRWQFRVRLGV